MLAAELKRRAFIPPESLIRHEVYASDRTLWEELEKQLEAEKVLRELRREKATLDFLAADAHNAALNGRPDLRAHVREYSCAQSGQLYWPVPEKQLKALANQVDETLNSALERRRAAEALEELKLKRDAFERLGFYDSLDGSTRSHKEAPLVPEHPPKVSLSIRIINAAGLRGADSTLLRGKSDPYCICQLVGKPETAFKTEVVKKTLDPVWNHEQVLHNVALTDSLDFHVYDWDRTTKSDSLGHVTLEPSQFLPHGFAGKLKLADAGKKPCATLTIGIEVKGIVLEVETDKNEPLGLGVADPPECYIGRVGMGLWADRVGIQVGDYITNVNGDDTGTMHRDDFLLCMQRRPLKMTVLRPDVEVEASGKAAEVGDHAMEPIKPAAPVQLEHAAAPQTRTSAETNADWADAELERSIELRLGLSASREQLSRRFPSRTDDSLVEELEDRIGLSTAALRRARRLEKRLFLNPMGETEITEMYIGGSSSQVAKDTQEKSDAEIEGELLERLGLSDVSLSSQKCVASRAQPSRVDIERALEERLGLSNTYLH